MGCKKRQQLFDEYESLVTMYFQAVINMRNSLFDSGDNHRESRNACEDARHALERHEHEHG